MIRKEKVDTEQEKEMHDLGFTEARQRRGLIRWFLAISVLFNMVLFKAYRETNKANEKVLHEILEKQLETKQKVDSLKVRL